MSEKAMGVAIKIHKEMGCLCQSPKYCACVEIIAKAIDQACAEARDEGWSEAIKRLDGIKAEGYSMGFADCLEIAAKMIEERKGIPEHHSDLASLVRALTPPTKENS